MKLSGLQNSHVGSDSLAYGFAGEAFESVSKLAYHRARWMDPTGGRFVGADLWHGNLESPLTLHRYAYVFNNPANLIDANGLSPSIFIDWGNQVHNYLYDHFRNTCSPGCSRTNLSIGRILGTGGASVRPDLVDICGRYVYEIKTVLEFTGGIVQVEGYVDTMNQLDPSAKTNPWRIGGPYVPPSVVPLEGGSFAIVEPPDYGVIAYQVVDMRAILFAAGAAIASDVGARLVANASSALSMASLGFVY